MLQQLIKYTGSKRTQANTILEYIPKKGNVYYEPFLGSGSVFYAMMDSDLFNYQKYVLSDVNKDVVDLHKYLLFEDIDAVIEQYEYDWNKLKEQGQSYYYFIRERFNGMINRNPSDFLFITRTCANGLIRYNNKGGFNNPFHHNRDGILPSNLKKIIQQYRQITEDKNIEFIVQSFNDIKNINTKDYFYLDPPYTLSNKMYLCWVTQEEIEFFCNNLPCCYGLSYNGRRGDIDNETTLNISNIKKIEIPNKNSSFNRLFQKTHNEVIEYFYYNEI